jgi:Zn-dependent peptidase ImmA (M78 family)/transcriptional regulator with XRE-family HTH domain
MSSTHAREVPTPDERFRHDLLGLRRRMLGLTQSEVADRAGMSQALYSNIEQGLRPMTADLADNFADALDCSATFFTQSEREYGAPLSAHPMYRKRASVGQKVLDKTIAEFSVRLAHTRTFLRAVEVEPELPMPVYDVEEFGGDAAEVASNVRRAWYMPRGPVVSLVEWLERAGCIVVACDMTSSKIDAASYRVAGLPPVIFFNPELPGDRLRFTLAHELGHLVMHAFPTPNMEREADQFASAFLMPAADIRPDLAALTLGKAAALKPVWKVSMGALIYRAADLKTITENQVDYLWRVRAQKGWNVQEPPSLDIERERPTLIDALIRRMLEEHELTNTQLAQTLHLGLDEISRLYRLEQPQAPRGLRRVK